MEKNIWGIHTTDDKLFLVENVIALGWKDIGDLSSLPNDREIFKAKYQSTYPGSKLKSTSLSAGMLYRFLYERGTAYVGCAFCFCKGYDMIAVKCTFGIF